jgi:hypothetical protein
MSCKFSLALLFMFNIIANLSDSFLFFKDYSNSMDSKSTPRSFKITI